MSMTSRLTPIVVAALACALAAAGCGGAPRGTGGTTASTALVIRASNGVAGTAVFTLRCDPP